MVNISKIRVGTRFLIQIDEISKLRDSTKKEKHTLRNLKLFFFNHIGESIIGFSDLEFWLFFRSHFEF